VFYVATGTLVPAEKSCGGWGFALVAPQCSAPRVALLRVDNSDGSRMCKKLIDDHRHIKEPPPFAGTLLTVSSLFPKGSCHEGDEVLHS
jgi:hypothetical protein